MHLVIGGTGLIGSAVCRELGARNLKWAFTTRRPSGWHSHCSHFGARLSYLNLAEIDFSALPSIVDGALFLIAAMPGYSPCEDSPLSWRVNADAPVAIAKRYRNGIGGAFPVFISSDVVEKSGVSAYQTQKRFAESYFNTIDAAIIRPARVPPERVGELAKLIVDIGLSRKAGVTRWPS